MSETEKNDEATACYLATLAGHDWESLPDEPTGWLIKGPSKAEWRKRAREAREYTASLHAKYDRAFAASQKVRQGRQ